MVELSGPGSTYLTGPIQLASHIDLQVDSGVTLKAVPDQARFTYAFIGHGFNPDEALVTAYDASDVAITGTGTIDGQGSLWWPAATATADDIDAAGSSVTTFAALAAWAAANPTLVEGPSSTYASYGSIPTSNGLPRPWLIEFYGVTGATVSGIHLQNSPMWHFGLRYSSDALFVDYNVDTSPTSPNTDGLDIVSSHDVAVIGANIADGDDNIAIKSGFPGFATPAVAASDIVVAFSNLGAGHGFSIGSEADNGVNNLYATNITWDGTEYGFRIKSGRDRGSQFDDIVLNNLSMTDVEHPIYLTDYYTSQPAAFTDLPQPVTATTPFVHDVTISNLKAVNDANMTEATSSEIIGLPEAPMQDIVLENVSLEGFSTPSTSARGIELRNVSGTFDNVSITDTATPFIVDEGVSVANNMGLNLQSPPIDASAGQ